MAAESRASAFGTRDALGLAACLIVAVVVRLGVLRELERSVYGHALMPDEDVYQRWATQLANGNALAHTPRDFACLPAHVFALVYRVFGTEPEHLRSFNLLVGVILCVVTYACASRLYGRAAGLVAAALCTLCEPLTFYSATLLSTNLGLLAFSVCFTLLVYWPEPAAHDGADGAWSAVRWGLLAAIGGTLGILVNLRGNAGVLLLAAAGWITFGPDARAEPRSRRVSGLVLLLVAYLLAGNLSGSPFGPAFGANLYLGHQPDVPSPYFRAAPFASSQPDLQAVGFTVEASRRTGRTLSDAEAQRFWLSETWQQARAQPADLLARTFAKARALLHHDAPDNDFELRILRPLLPMLRVAFVPGWLLFALGLGLGTLLPLDRRVGLGALVFTAYGATLLVFFVGERLRAPLVWLAIPYAAGALRAAARTLRAWSSHSTPQRRRLLMALGATLGVTALIWTPLPAADDLSQADNAYALTLLDAGQPAEAERWYRKSLALRGADSPGAGIGLAAIAHQKHQPELAAHWLEQVPDSYYEAASKYEWQGQLALERRDPAVAATAYERALTLDTSRLTAYKGLYIAYRLLGRTDLAADADARLTRITAFYGQVESGQPAR